MLISIVMDPTCLTPKGISCGAARAGAERLLDGVLRNGVLLAADSRQYVAELASAASGLGARTGQLIQLYIAEIGKRSSMYIATDSSLQIGSFKPPTLARLRDIALALHADIVVCRDPPDTGFVADLRNYGTEVCTLSNYELSKAEARRRGWTQTTRIDHLSAVDSEWLVGRTLRYATEILVCDKYIAHAAKSGWMTPQLKRFGKSLVYVARCWKKHSPYARFQKPNINILSVAGGNVNPYTAEKVIRQVVSRLDSNRCIGKVYISLKIDRHPSITSERYLSAMGRCFGVQHGIDDLGNLTLPQSKRRPTSLLPDCQVHRDLLGEIQALRPAQ